METKFWIGFIYGLGYICTYYMTRKANKSYEPQVKYGWRDVKFQLIISLGSWICFLIICLMNPNDFLTKTKKDPPSWL